MGEITKEMLLKSGKYIFDIPKSFNPEMRVPARIFTSEAMLEDILEDRSLIQIANVATLPGIQKFAYAMPDIHQGYGFPIGGVAAMDINNSGVISPGGIGYDINCGVRLLSVSMSAQDIKAKLEDLATELFYAVPSGVGRGGKIKIKDKELDKVLSDGAHRMLSLGYGIESDIENCEEHGKLKNANPNLVSDKAKNRGHDQLGTLGSGNHFLEVQYVEEIFDEQEAKKIGIKKDQITIMIHCGSRGLGHQTCTDYVKNMLPNLDKWKIKLPDPELACAPFNSKEGQEYFAAMAACANFAWANRHVIGHQVRQAFDKVFGSGVFLKTVYDVSHNIGKKEIHNIDGKQKELIVHRKGATRAFHGQPVLIPGTMGTSSYILSGTETGMEQSFGSCCHGAGRRLSRIKAKKTVRGSDLRKELEEQGIIIRCESDPGLAEEAPIAYKDVDNVIEVVQSVGLANRVAKLKPLAVIKGG